MTTRNKTLTILAATVAAISILALAGCGGDGSSADTKAEAQVQAQADPAFTPVHFAAMDISGTQHQSTEWIGKKPVVLNFWGTWCPPCRKEIPELVKLHNEYQDKVELVSLAVRDTPTKVENFSSAQGMEWLMLIAENDILLKYNVTVGVPTTIFLDKNGKEVARFVGPRSYETFKQAAETVIAAA